MQGKEISNGSIVEFNGEPVIIESVKVQTPSARGAATLYKFRGRNLVTKNKVDITLKGTEQLPQADFQKRAVSVMYTDPDQIHLMDSEDYNQYSIGLDLVKWEMNFILEGTEGLYALIYNDECVGVQLPTSVELNVVECDPAVRGNSATSRAKAAKLETGFEIQVPEHLKEGQRVKVDTRSGEFISRV